MKRITLEPGQRFGRLTILNPCPRWDRVRKRLFWQCVCDCGTTRWFRADKLKVSVNPSCGCLGRDIRLAKNTTHGRARTPEHGIWISMIQRCTNPRDRAYSTYGGRGITICSEWDDFATFYRDMGPRPSPQHSLDRANNNLGYSKDNCRWATQAEQMRNTRHNHWLSHNGKTMVLADWAKELGLSSNSLSNRLGRGWPIERALSEPNHRHGATHRTPR